METKCFEVRDEATFIPVMATRISPRSHEDARNSYLLRRAAFHPQGTWVFLTQLSNSQTHANYHDWPSHTMTVAHAYIDRHWDALEPGAVIDVEYIQGFRKEPKLSERVTNPPITKYL